MTQRKQFSSGYWLLLILSFNMLISCADPSIDRTIEASDVSLEIFRLDRPLFEESASLEKVHFSLLKDHPEFYPIYFRDILQLGDPSDSLAIANLEQFIRYPDMVETQNQIDSVFGDFSELEKNLRMAFGRYVNIYPGKKVPTVYVMNSGFNFGVFPDAEGDYLGIGSEFFIGDDNPVVTRLPNEIFPAYIRKQMIPEQLLPSAIKGLLLTTYNEPPSKADLLNLMVTYGKIMYTLHLTIPDISEHLQFSYTPDQMEWCIAHEKDIWQAIVKQKLLYVSDRKTLTDWMGRGPNSRGFSEESPAELAYFMGKQMVKDYMAEHPEVSVEELVMVPATSILKSYSPGG